jgi:hypothetical protein
LCSQPRLKRSRRQSRKSRQLKLTCKNAASYSCGYVQQHRSFHQHDFTKTIISSSIAAHTRIALFHITCGFKVTWKKLENYSYGHMHHHRNFHSIPYKRIQ